MLTAPRMCPAAYSSAGRTSSTVTLAVLARRRSWSRVTGSPPARRRDAGRGGSTPGAVGLAAPPPPPAAGPEVGDAAAFDTGEVRLRDPPQSREQARHARAGQPVQDPRAVAA